MTLLRHPARAVAGLAVLAVLAIAAVAGSGYRDAPLTGRATPADAGTAAARAEAKLAAKVPDRPYVIIDQTRNRLEVRRGGGTLVSAVCSSGSGMVLQEAGDGGRRWVFDTPRGRYSVRSKLEHPVWRKPDWAFIEEGRTPPDDPGERIEYGALGDYALYFGNGYLIHGTLYERLLGRSVTHGCIRLGRDDLATVYRLCPVGTSIYIF